MKMNKVIVLLATMICVSLCNEDQEAVDFLKHLKEISKPNEISTTYWSEKIFKVAEDHSKEADALRTLTPGL